MMSIGTLTNPLEYEMLECLFFGGVTLYSYMLCSNWPSKHNMRLRSACRVCRGKTKSIDWQLALSMSAQWANVPAFLWRNPMLISCATPSQARISKQGGSWNQRIVMVVLFTVSVDSEEYQRLLLGSASSSSSWQVAKDAAAGIEASDHILVISSFSNIQNNMCDTLQASWTILRKSEIELIMKWRCIWYSTYSRMVGWWSFEAFFGGANPPDCHWGRSRRGRVWYLQLEHSGTVGWYCWWTKSCTTKDDDYPIIYKVLYIPGGAGFLPSTVSTPLQWFEMESDLCCLSGVLIPTRTPGRWRQDQCSALFKCNPFLFKGVLGGEDFGVFFPCIFGSFQNQTLSFDPDKSLVEWNWITQWTSFRGTGIRCMIDLLQVMYWYLIFYIIIAIYDSWLLILSSCKNAWFKTSYCAACASHLTNSPRTDNCSIQGKWLATGIGPVQPDANMESRKARRKPCCWCVGTWAMLNLVLFRRTGTLWYTTPS